MMTHSRVLAWKIPWIEEPGGLQSIELQRVGQDWSDLAAAVAPSLQAEMGGGSWWWKIVGTWDPQGTWEKFDHGKVKCQVFCFAALNITRFSFSMSLCKRVTWHTIILNSNTLSLFCKKSLYLWDNLKLPWGLTKLFLRIIGLTFLTQKKKACNKKLNKISKILRGWKSLNCD